MKFKRAILASVAGASLLFSAPAVQAADYTIDPTHSFVQFKISHLGFSWTIGTFDEMSGNFSYDPEAGPEAQRIEVEVDTASIDSGHAERDKHLRSADFLNVKEFPTATFSSSGYEGDAEGGVMNGELTVHGVTRPISVSVKKIGEGNDPWGRYRAGFEGSVVLDRRDFGVDRNLGPASNQFELYLSIEGVRD